MSNVVQINFDLIVISGHVMLCLLAGYVVVITSIIYNIEYHRNTRFIRPEIIESIPGF